MFCLLKRGVEIGFWENNARFHIICGIHHEFDRQNMISNLGERQPTFIHDYAFQVYDKLLDDEQCNDHIKDKHYMIGGELEYFFFSERI